MRFELVSRIRRPWGSFILRDDRDLEVPELLRASVRWLEAESGIFYIAHAAQGGHVLWASAAEISPGSLNAIKPKFLETFQFELPVQPRKTILLQRST